MSGRTRVAPGRRRRAAVQRPLRGWRLDTPRAPGPPRHPRDRGSCSRCAIGQLARAVCQTLIWQNSHSLYHAAPRPTHGSQHKKGACVRRRDTRGRTRDKFVRNDPTNQSARDRATGARSMPDTNMAILIRCAMRLPVPHTGANKKEALVRRRDTRGRMGSQRSNAHTNQARTRETESESRSRFCTVTAGAKPIVSP